MVHARCARDDKRPSVDMGHKGGYGGRATQPRPADPRGGAGAWVWVWGFPTDTHTHIWLTSCLLARKPEPTTVAGWAWGGESSRSNVEKEEDRNTRKKRE